MSETIYNLFYYVTGDAVTAVALCAHQHNGTDHEKEMWLRDQAPEDCLKAKPTPLLEPLLYRKFVALHRLGRHLEVFEPLLASVGASPKPLYCITAIVDGQVRIDALLRRGPFNPPAIQSPAHSSHTEMSDWLSGYTTAAGIDLPRLLNDDYFNAIRILFNAAQYVSCMKLLVSFIDTISFLAYGDERSVFIRWLDTYAQVGRLGITSEELWELRNSLLHMSNLDSRRVVQCKVRRIGFCVARSGTSALPTEDVAYFNLLDLITEIASATSKWIDGLNADPDSFLAFVFRYDRVVADARVAVAIHNLK